MIFVPLALATACTSTSYEPQISSQAYRDAIIHTMIEIEECVEKRETGIINSHRKSAECGNAAIKRYVLPHAPYPYLVDNFMASRAEIATKVDRNEITFAQSQNMMAQERLNFISKEQYLLDRENKQDWDSERNNNTFRDFKCEPRRGHIKCSRW